MYLRGTVQGYTPSYSEVVPFTVNLFKIFPTAIPTIEYFVGTGAKYHTFPAWNFFPASTIDNLVFSVAGVGNTPPHGFSCGLSVSDEICISTSDPNDAGVYQLEVQGTQNGA